MRNRDITLVRAAALLGTALVVLVESGSASSALAKPCAGSYPAADLERFLPSARLALSLPNTEAVAFEPGDRCIRITVRSAGTGRLVKLILRGVAVPRAAVQLDLAPAREAPGS